MALKNYMIKPNLKVVNFNIDYKLPKKEVEYNKTQVMMYGRTADIDKRFPNGKEKIVEPKTGTADPSADIPIFGGPLIPISLSAAVGKATTNMKAVAGVALSSVGAMGSGLQALAGGSADELIALAKLDQVILEAKAELGEISEGNKDKLTMGIETDIIKAGAIKTPGDLGDALSMGDIGGIVPAGVGGSLAGIDGDGFMASGAIGKGLKLPAVSKAVDSSGALRNFNIDKTLGFRDIVENVDAVVTDFVNNDISETFAKIKRTTRIFGSETDLNSKFGTVDNAFDPTIRRAAFSNDSAITSSNVKSIAKFEWVPGPDNFDVTYTRNGTVASAKPSAGKWTEST